jgi:hypothetical protein
LVTRLGLDVVVQCRGNRILFGTFPRAEFVVTLFTMDAFCEFKFLVSNPLAGTLLSKKGTRIGLLMRPPYRFRTDGLLIMVLHELVGNTLLEPIFKGISSNAQRSTHVGRSM